MTDKQSHFNEPKLRDTLRNDLNQPDLFQNIRREFDELQEFYISEEKQTEFEAMHWGRRWILVAGWLVRCMLLKLSPLQRLLVIIGSVFVLFDGTMQFGKAHAQTSVNWHILGWLFLIFVLMLELKNRILARSELEAGRSVQRAMMPEPFPKFSGWSIALSSQPAIEVGGDLVDFIRINSTKASIVLGDVSGKGLKAALMMAKLQTTIRVLAFEFAETVFPMSKLNTIFKRDGVTGMFASLLMTDFTVDGDTINYINAGHLPPLVVSANGVEEMQKGEPALGIMTNTEYSQRSVTLQPGDIFFAFSDGLSEARNEYKDLFTTERLKKLLPSLRSHSVDEISREITSAVERFVGNSRVHDDFSFIIIKKM